jgi:2-aminophenol/2-amino-5-chlorophenol 1,6-dioxygenase alpha subunit
MTIVSAFMIPSSALPYVQSDNPPWGRLADAMKKASKSLAASKPDTIVIYSTTWCAVMDQLWQTRPQLKGVHVDANWHEYGELPFDIHIDTDLAEKAVFNANEAGIKSKGVNYDQFPIDTGTIVASNFLNPGNKLPLMLASNNLYHDWERTEALGEISAKAAEQLGKRVAIVVIGNLSSTFYRHNINISEDKIASEQDDQWNQKVLDLLSKGQVKEFFATCPDYTQEINVDMGLKHMAFLKGALGEKLSGGEVLAYEPLYGSGGAVIEFSIKE